MRVSTSGSVRGASGRRGGGANFLLASATRIRSPVKSQVSTRFAVASGSASSRAFCSGVKGRAGPAVVGDVAGTGAALGGSIGGELASPRGASGGPSSEGGSDGLERGPANRSAQGGDAGRFLGSTSAGAT